MVGIFTLTLVWFVLAATACGNVLNDGGETGKFYEIHTVEEFLGMANNRNYKLMADLDFEGQEFVPVPQDHSSYIAIFDGNSHTLKNITCESASTDGIGVFTYIGTSGTIKNLNVENINLKGNGRIGGIAAQSHGKIENCIIKSGTIIGEGNADVGGIVGYKSLGDVVNCENFAAVSGNGVKGKGSTGGIVGSASTEKLGITNCKNHGDISGVELVGGIIGYARGVKITGSLNDGDISGKKYTGGIVAMLQDGSEMSQCSTSGAVIGVEHFGKYTGIFYSNTIISNIPKVKITTPEQLSSELAIANDFLTYQLTADLDYSAVRDFTPIENFTATLDGNGHSISGLTISTREQNIGFFGELKGTVNNLNFDGASITVSGESKNIGIIAGKNLGAITQCMVGGKVDARYSENVGGVCGWNAKKVDNCTNNAEVIGSISVGGIFGYANSRDVMNMLTNDGSVSGNRHIGGVAGVIENGQLTVAVNNGIVTAKKEICGGVIGKISNAECSDARNNMDISCDADYVGGIFGSCYKTKSSTLKNIGNVKGGNYVGGFFGKVETDNMAGMHNVVNVTGNAYVGGIAGKAIAIVLDMKNSGTILSEGYLLSGTKKLLYVGGIAGECRKVESCVNEGEITVKFTGDYLGGVAGRSTDAVDCENYVDIKNGGEYVGGVIGECAGNANDLTNEGDVVGQKYVGGVVGMVGARSSDSLRNYGIVSGETHVGGVIGYSKSKVMTCENFGAVSGDKYVGGYIGYAETQILDLTNTVEVTGKTYVGGIAGMMYNGENLVNSGVITASGKDTNGNTYAGGICGRGSILTACRNTATIKGTGNYVGGIAGDSISTANCVNEGEVTAANYVAGIGGKFASDCTNSGNIMGEEYVGGIVACYECNRSEDLVYKLYGNTNSGKISGRSMVGGIIGKMQINRQYSRGSGHVNDNVNTGEVHATVSNAGGILGGMGVYLQTHGFNDFRTYLYFYKNNNSGKVMADVEIAGGIGGNFSGVKKKDMKYPEAIYTYVYDNISSGAVSAPVSSGDVYGKNSNSDCVFFNAP